MDSTTTDEAARLKREYVRTAGFWPSVHDALLQLDPSFLGKFLELSAAARSHNALDPKIREFIAIAIDAATTHLYNVGTRNHIRQALALGATKEEILEVLEIVSLLGIHTTAEAMPILLAELEDLEAKDAGGTNGTRAGSA